MTKNKVTKDLSAATHEDNVDVQGISVCARFDGEWFVHAGQMHRALGYGNGTNVGVLTRHAAFNEKRYHKIVGEKSAMWMSLTALQRLAHGKNTESARTARIDEFASTLLGLDDNRDDTGFEEPTDEPGLSQVPDVEEDMHTLRFGTHKVRVFVDSGNDFMVLAKDVCDALGLDNVTMALEGVPDSKKGIRKVYTHGGIQPMRVITEGAMYTVAIRSKRPEAEKFVNWAEEVLTTIRRQGYYTAPGAGVSPGPDVEVLVRLADTLDRIDQRHGLLEARSAQASQAVNELGGRISKLESAPQAGPVDPEQIGRMVQSELDKRTFTRDHDTGPYYGAPIPLQYRGWFLAAGIGKKIETPEDLRNFLPTGEKFKTLGSRDVLRLMAHYGVLDYQPLAPEGTLKWIPKGKLQEVPGKYCVIINQCVGHHTDGSPVYSELLLFSPEYAQLVIDFLTKKTTQRELIRRMISSWPSKYRKKDMDQFLSKEEATKLWTMVKEGRDPITGVPPTDDEVAENGA